MKNDVTIMRVIMSLITHLLFSSRLVPFTLILNPNCPSLCSPIHPFLCLFFCPFSLSLSPNLFTHLRTDISSFFTSTPPLLYHAHLCMYSSHVTVFGSLFFLNKICLHMVIRSSTHSIFTCVLI
jgi:hypothetical protein